jgi:hypothetical protein
METVKKTKIHREAQAKAVTFKSTSGYIATILDTKI